MRRPFCKCPWYNYWIFAHVITERAQELLRDTETADIIQKSMNGEIEPIQDKVEDGVLLVHEAQEQANLDTSSIGVIGMYKMLEDPIIQRNLKFMKALLAIMSERQKKEFN